MRRANHRRAIVTWSTTSVLVVALLVTWAASAQARTAWAGPFAVDLYGSPAHRLTVTVARPALIVGSKLGGEVRSGKVNALAFDTLVGEPHRASTEVTLDASA